MLTRQRLKWMIVGATVLAVLWLLSSYAVAYRLTRRPRAICEEPMATIGWGRIENVRLTTRDDEELGAWFVEGRPEEPVVLLLHGYAQSRQHCLEQAEVAAETGCSVLLLSIRAHGDSTGEFNDFGYGARHDVVAAVAWLEKHCPGRPILIWGQSLGSAAALYSAEELEGRVSGYLLECPFQDLRTAVRNRTRVYLPRGLDLIAYTGLLTVAPLVLPDVDQLSPLNAAESMPPSVPVLILAGGADRRALPDEARAIHARLRGPAKLVVIKNGDHSQLLRADPIGYRAAVKEFLNKCRVHVP